MSTYIPSPLKTLIAATFLTLLATATAQSQTAKEIEDLNAQVQSLIQMSQSDSTIVSGQSQIEAAIPLAERALDGARKLRPTKKNSEILTISLINLASVEAARGRFDRADELYSECLQIVKKSDPSSYDMASDLRALAQIGALFQDGKVAEAELLAEKTLANARRLKLPPGTMNPILAPSLQLLAQIYLALWRFGDAEPLLNEELALLRKGSRGSLSINAVAVLAATARAHVLYQKSKTVEAVSLAEKTIVDADALPRSKGNDLALAYSLINLADLYRGLGRDSEAARLYSRALSLFKNVFPNGTPLAAVAIEEADYRAQAMFANGNIADGVSLAEESLRGSRRIANGPLTTECLHTVFLMYEAMGRYREAENILLEDLALLRKQLGDHPLVASILADLGVVYDYEGRYEEAESSYAEAMEIWKKFHFEDHPNIAETLGNLGHLYYVKGRFKDAKNRYDEALVMWERLGIKENSFVASCLNGLASLYFDQSRFQDAEIFVSKAQDMLERLGYTSHPALALLLSNRANIYLIQGRDREANSLFLQALDIFRILGLEDHPFRAQCLNGLALLNQRQLNYKDAEQYYLEALTIWNRISPKHPDSALVRSNLGSLYVEQGEFAKARQPVFEALEIWQKRLPSGHPAIAIGLNNLALFYYAQRQYQKAEPLNRQAVEILKASLPNNDLTLAGGLQNLALVIWAGRPSSKDSLQEVSQLLSESAEMRIAVLGRELVRGTGIAAVQDNLARVLTFEGASADVALSFAVRPQGLVTNAETAKTALLEEWAQKGRAQEEARRQPHPPRPFAVDEARSQLSKGAALLEFAVYHDIKPGMTKAEMGSSERRYAVCILRWDLENPVCVGLAAAADIDAEVEHFLKLVRSAHSSGSSFAGLPQRLEPILAYLDLVEQLFVAEDGDLRMVPLQALKTKQAGSKTWIDLFEITYLNTGRDLVWRRGERAANGPAVVAGLNSYGPRAPGSPTFASINDDALCPQDGSEFMTLQKAEPMAELAAKSFGVQPLLGFAATRENLKKAVMSDAHAPRVVVLAFHGCIRKGRDLEEPELQLVVSDGKKSWTFLGAREVASWPLEGSGLYILACGAGSPIGEVVGDLRQAGTLAGVRFIVAPLWDVTDIDANRFLTLLLEQPKKLSLSAALRETQKKMRATNASPAYWAGYTVNGVGATEGADDSARTSQPKADATTPSKNLTGEKPSGVVASGTKANCANVENLTLSPHSHESFYLGVRFGNGSAEIIHIRNSGSNEEAVKIERYSANGCLLESIDRIVPAGQTSDVRVEDSAQKLCPDYGWIRVISKGRNITISDTQEVLRGNTLISVERGEPSSRDAAGHLSHRWVESLVDNSDRTYFVNLSGQPVRVGICQSDRRDFFCGALDHTVAPMEQIGFNLDRIHQYAVVESTPGPSVSQSIKIVDGSKRFFRAPVKIKFGDVVLPPAVEAATPIDQAQRQKQINASRTEGALFFENGEYEHAINAYYSGLDIDPDNTDLLLGLRRACEANASKPEAIARAIPAAVREGTSSEALKPVSPAPRVPQPQDWIGNWESVLPATWDTDCYLFSSKKPSTTKENLRFQIVSVNALGQVTASFAQHQVSPSLWTGEATATRLVLEPPALPKGILLPDLNKLVEQSGRIEFRRDGNSYSAVFSYKRKENVALAGIHLATCRDDGSFAGPIRRNGAGSLDFPRQAGWTKDQIIRMLNGDVSPEHVETLVQERGIDFQLTADVENELRGIGADDALIRLLKDATRTESSLALPTQVTNATDGLKVTEPEGATTNVTTTDKPLTVGAQASGTTAEYAGPPETQGDIGPFKVLHDHNFWVDSLLKSFVFQDDDFCDGWLGVRNDTVWFKSDKKPKHSFSIPISQVRKTAREGLSGIITLRLRNGRKYKFYADVEAAQKFVARVQIPSR